jgi:hypothetical protein
MQVYNGNINISYKNINMSEFIGQCGGDSSDSYIKKWTALSVVKFVCVAFMLFIHAHMVLITQSYAIANTSGFFYKVTSNLMFLGLFLFTLPIIAGAILRMDFSGHIIRGKLENYNLKNIIRVSVLLFLAGFFMNVITWGIWYIFSWNVLQLIGLSFIVIAILLRVFSIRAVFLVGLIAVFAAQPLRNLLAGHGFNYFTSIFVGADNAFIFWPFFPWFGIVAFGFLFAHYYLEYKDSINFRINAIILGIILVASAVFRGEISPYLDPKYIWGPSIFQPKIGLVFASAGVFCIMVVLSNIFFNKAHFKKYGIINSYSKGILWIYVLQMFASYKLSFLIKRFFSMDTPSLAYFILPILMLLFGWIIGALSIKLLQEKLIVVKLKKIP